MKRPLEPVLGALKVRHVIVTGRSQSAFRLVTFINAVHPLAPLADGFLVHSRSAAAAGLTADGLGRDADTPIPPGAQLRSDLRVPVLDLLTEGDIVNLRAHLTPNRRGPVTADGNLPAPRTPKRRCGSSRCRRRSITPPAASIPSTPRLTIRWRRRRSMRSRVG